MTRSTAAADRVWFITGASSGLGLAFTRAALDAGDRVGGAMYDVAQESADRRKEVWASWESVSRAAG
ncbi:MULTISPECIES: hypothetical protein [unclassified Streptomyces]|uniref:hypothetical protein n=1 Tax=unclassified Streptomyces TaxID=2593676 RepID=UPI003870A8B6